MIVLDSATARHLRAALALYAETLRRRGRRPPPGMAELFRGLETTTDAQGRQRVAVPGPVDQRRDRHDSAVLLSRGQAARLLGVSVRQLDRLTASGKITPKRIGRRVLFHRSEIERYARGHR